MNCKACEVARARLIALAMLLVGRSQEQIAEHLTVKYGVVYFVDKGAIWRSNNPANIHIVGD